MFDILLFVHSVMRWVVLISLLTAIYKACDGYMKGRVFSNADNALRHWTATIAHIQLMVGMLVYTQSPNAKFSFKQPVFYGHITPTFFFGVLHLLMMLSAIVLITVGSATAKRKAGDRQKFKTMLIWFGIALLVILLAIPWPFSPLAQRAYLRSLH
ncbi:MAG: hypothetical protein JKY70_20265 [Mucilaginibacter sp.]|nr:hypothetical protein [Mucilaginibacter sp.]